MSNTAKKFITGALILAAAGMFAKFLSIFFRIPLVWKIGDVGIGYYQLAYPIYTLLIAISYVGLPSAISKLVSEKMVNEDYYEANRIFKVSLAILSIIGLFTSALLFFGAEWIIQVRNWSPEVKYSLWGLAAAPFFVSIMGAFRGYFQGMQNMLPTGVSQVVESFVRVIIGIGFAYALCDYSLGLAAGGATFGATAGAMAGSFVLWIMYLKYKRQMNEKIATQKEISKKESIREIGKKVFLIAIPVTIGSAVGSVIALIDSMVIVSRLKSVGIDDTMATAMFGQLTGKAQTLINVPLTLSMAVALSILPAVSEAVARCDKEDLYQKINAAIRFSMILGLPAAMGLCALAYPIFDLFYPNHADGSVLLSILSIALIFIIIGQLFTAVLQGMGHFYRPIINLVAGALVKVVLNYILVGTSLLVNGAAISSICAYATYAILNYLYIKKKSNYKIKDYGIILKPLISSIVMAISTMTIYYFSRDLTHSSKAGTLIAILAGVGVYTVMLMLTKTLTEEELKGFPKGYIIIKVFKKLRLL
ncbi:MAG TPA: polysaccharide biosynthesis protein [Clostridiales bacterium]|nr:MAG: hypothetical protein A2Y22_01445 [Clostridiales bacterium GWD2_32_59]HAN10810.1 polysaccharide biosynthesis protein [Clostridiales bacterium]